MRESLKKIIAVKQSKRQKRGRMQKEEEVNVAKVTFTKSTYTYTTKERFETKTLKKEQRNWNDKKKWTNESIE